MIRHAVLHRSLVLLIAAVTPLAMANIPPLITGFQGVLRDTTDRPLDGPYPIVVRYWSHASSNDAAYDIGSESHPAVTVTGGLFELLLGSQPFVAGASGYGGSNIGVMFGDFDQVFLQLEVDGDVLLPRVRFAAAPYAFNCTQLQDKGPGEFLRSEGSDNFTGSALYGYALTFDPGTTLNVAGALQLGGAAMTSSAAELNKLDGTGSSVTPANLTTLTSGAIADMLHVHTNIDAAKIDGLDSSQFLRSDASDSYTVGTLSFAAGTIVSVGGSLRISGASPLAIDFANGEAAMPELRLHEHGAGFADDRFEATRSLSVSGLFHAGPSAEIAPGRAYHFFGDYTAGAPVSGRVTDEDDLFVMHDVEAGDSLTVGRLFVATGNNAARTYSAYGSGNPQSSDMTTADDLHVTSDLEVGGSFYAISGVIAGDAIPTTGQIFNSFGDAAGQDAAEIGSLADVYIAQDLEVDGTVNANFVHAPDGVTLNLYSDGIVRTMIDDNNNATTTVADWFHDGSTANTSKLAELQEDGDLRIRGALTENVAFDVAESFVMSEPIAAGELVAADPLRPGAVRRTAGEDDPLVLGVVSAGPGLLLGGAPFDAEALGERWGAELRAEFETQSTTILERLVLRMTEAERSEIDAEMLESLALADFFARRVAPVALAGRVRVRVDAGSGSIHAGDPLGPGPNPGIAIRVRDGGPAIGIALEPLAVGRGEILAFVHRSVVAPTGPMAERPASAATGATVGRLTGGVPGSESAMAAEGVAIASIVSPDSAAAAAPPPLLAAAFPSAGPIEPGDVVALDPEGSGAVRAAHSALDPRVVGVAVAGSAPPGQVLVALGGVATCRVDATDGPIVPGDLLATSIAPGHASRAVVALPGTIVAKALEPLAAGRGVIRVLVVAR